MVDEDGWCLNLDRETRKCLIYDRHPRFCRVQLDTFGEMYGVTESEFNDIQIK